MSINFGKLNFSTAFNPTSAFPLDAREYFESIAAAQTAANTAEEAGSSDSKYYFGEKLVVQEKNASPRLFIIVKIADTSTKGYHGDLLEIPTSTQFKKINNAPIIGNDNLKLAVVEDNNSVKIAFVDTSEPLSAINLQYLNTLIISGGDSTNIN